MGTHHASSAQFALKGLHPEVGGRYPELKREKESGAFSLRFLSVMPRIDEIELMDILIQPPSMVFFLD